MNIVKVYDINGKHVDSFRKLQKKRAIYGPTSSVGSNYYHQLITYMNKRKLFVRRQLTNTRAALGNVGLFPNSYIGASIRSIFK